LIGKKWSDEAPPVRVRRAAVDEHDPGSAGAPPPQVADRTAIYVDVAGFVRRGHRVDEPFRRRFDAAIVHHLRPLVIPYAGPQRVPPNIAHRTVVSATSRWLESDAAR